MLIGFEIVLSQTSQQETWPVYSRAVIVLTARLLILCCIGLQPAAGTRPRHATLGTGFTLGTEV